MATEALDNYHGIKHSGSSESLEKKWLLPKEKLEEIASLLESLNQRFVFNYREITEEQLPDLQEYCFKTAFEMCERGEWNVIQKIQDAIRGLRDLSGNTIFLKFVCDGKEAKEPKVIEDQLNAANALSDDVFQFALHQAVRFGKSLKSLEVIKQQGHCTSLQLDRKGRMPIHIAIKKNRADAIKCLLPKVDRAVSVPIICLSYHSNKKNMDICPMSLAVLKGYIPCVDELIRAGVVPAAVRIGDEKMTP